LNELEQREVERNWRETRDLMKPITKRLFEQHGDRVLSGPFRGMQLTKEVKWDDGNMACKLIGSYEFELHDAIRRAVARRPDTVINVGCAEGFYAVGLGRLLPCSEIFAFDIDDDSLDLCERNARANWIKNLTTVTGKPGPEDLDKGRGSRLYVVDAEGSEAILLNPDRCPALLVSDIIVECHDFFTPDTPISDYLAKVFSASHEVERIEPQFPRVGDYPFLHDQPWGTILLAITEKRPAQTVWLACWTKHRKEDLDG
jgi:hypothetical protein